jgi:ABC-type lipoprotein export system ATPase subunit
LTVRAGEFIAIMGPSGSGKSTLLHLLGLIDEPDEGELRLFGQATRDLDELARARLRNQKLGFAFQFDSLLPDFTVLENVTMPSRIAAAGGYSDAESRGKELLDRFGVGALAGRFPQELSGGERQRAAIARALVNRPSLLLADEPTGNLDRHNGELVFYALKQVADRVGVAVVLVTHNDYAAKFATRILQLSDGRVAEAGTVGPSEGILKP